MKPGGRSIVQDGSLRLASHPHIITRRASHWTSTVEKMTAIIVAIDIIKIRCRKLQLGSSQAYSAQQFQRPHSLISSAGSW